MGCGDFSKALLTLGRPAFSSPFCFSLMCIYFHLRLSFRLFLLVSFLKGK